jgi:endonuclease YncB( thermonuclease family)
MQTFKVTQIIDGDTFSVTPVWIWDNKSGDRVRPKGYDAPETGTSGAASATKTLSNLLVGQDIELSNAVTIDRGRLVCDVYLNGKNLADYFTRYQT